MCSVFHSVELSSLRVSVSSMLDNIALCVKTYVSNSSSNSYCSTHIAAEALTHCSHAAAPCSCVGSADAATHYQVTHYDCCMYVHWMLCSSVLAVCTLHRSAALCCAWHMTLHACHWTASCTRAAAVLSCLCCSGRLCIEIAYIIGY